VTAPDLDLDEARAIADRFGVAIEQVRRDHLISHVLAAVSRSHHDEVLFFGGTALARTLLPDGRLSEDVDLITLESRANVTAALEKTLASALRRSHGRITWAPALTAVRDTDAAILLAEDGRLTVRVQLLDHRGCEPWPTAIRDLEQRFSDAVPAALRVPTAPAVAAWKTVAWHDRAAPRDLWDLWAPAEHGHITTDPSCSPRTGRRGTYRNRGSSRKRHRGPLAVATGRPAVTAAGALDEVAAAWAATQAGVEH
jgi:predicted nucleotidyltransferase component of viral defense system